jgi:Secretion system C-terminal sorting domain
MKMALKFFLCMLPLLLGAHDAHAQCNGDPNLCNKRYDEVCYVTTHNAFNYQGAFILPNQSYDIAQQLQDGVRGLMLDVYWYNNRPTVYHGSSFLGNQPLADLLSDIKTFLDGNPDEVMTIIFECYFTAAQMNDAFTQASLLPYVHAQPQGSPWPTLADMIAADRRLVVFTDATDGAAYPWYHHVWDYAVETDYTAHSRSDFSCNYNRGDSSKSLFILNHMVTAQTIGTGILDSALAVNSNPYLLSRAMACWAATGKRPNFLTVDFYEQGNVMAAKDALNAGFAGIAPSIQPHNSITVAPNPVQDQISLHGLQATDGVHTFSLHDLQGRARLHVTENAGTENWEISVSTTLENGIYFWRIASKHDIATGKIMLMR